MSPVFSRSKNSHRTQIHVQVLGKNPLRVYESTFHCYYHAKCIENTGRNVRFLHQSVQLSYDSCPYLRRNGGGLLLEEIRYFIC